MALTKEAAREEFDVEKLLEDEQAWLRAVALNYTPRSPVGRPMHPDRVRQLLANRPKPLECPVRRCQCAPPDIIFKGPLSGVAVGAGKGRPIGGRLRLFTDRFRSAGYPDLADALQGGIPWRQEFVSLVPAVFENAPSCTKYQDFVDAEVQALLEVNAIAELPLGQLPVACVGLYVADDNLKKLQLVYDARYINHCDGTGAIILKGIESIKHFIRKGEWMVKTDVRSGYPHLPLRDKDLVYMCFHWRGRIYHWACMPFGIRSAPRWFVAATRPVAAAIGKELAVPFLLWIDDLHALLGTNLEEAKVKFEKIKEIWTRFGFVLAVEKLEGPATRVESLGCIVDSVLMIIQLAEKRICKIRNRAELLAGAQEVVARDVAVFAGVMNAADMGLKWGRRMAYPAYDLIRWIDPLRLTSTRVTVSDRLRLVTSWIKEKWDSLHGRPICDPAPRWATVSDSTPRRWADRKSVV